jgi:preprotein translocase subunit SecA
MDYLQQGIHLRGAAQIEPLVAYKNEAFKLFEDLMNNVWSDFARFIFHVEVTLQAEDGQPVAPQRSTPSPSSSSATGGGRVSYSGGSQSGAAAVAAAAGTAGLSPASAAAGAYEAAEEQGLPAFEPVEQRRVDEAEQIGRNDPCWCGSGKKYKKCHGA